MKRNLFALGAIAALFTLSTSLTARADDYEDYVEDLREAREDYCEEMREAREDYWEDREDYLEDRWDDRRQRRGYFAPRYRGTGYRGQGYVRPYRSGFGVPRYRSSGYRSYYGPGYGYRRGFGGFGGRGISIGW